ncbi:putative membrane protein [Salinivirga cyanobacteriivorans]|uniref:Putative membrane protein n=1 Tax=Salinivirga cyanobacteriivorans TaxID=1307839 RepID=A0A0S2HVZ7_9BACT|nr:YfhO family protein [Salinivirga cyanobacteriivorans]ALO14238.1 putative membrane protein [Salinivirga cyanobacteriivorans]
MEKQNMQQILKRIFPHVVAVGLFLIISYAYFSPQLEGKKLQSGDVANFKGAAKEIMDYRAETGEEALWTNRMFGGMPAYLISVKVRTNVFLYINKLLQIGDRPASYLFVCLLGFYLALLIFGVNPWLSMAGAIAYAFSSYFFIILAAGHMTKAVALTYMPAVIAGVYSTYRKKMWLGAAVTALFLGLQIKASHPQITYYTGMAVLIFVIFEFVSSIRKKQITNYLKKSALLLGVAVLALGSDIPHLWMTYEYGEYSIRGESELSDKTGNQTAGLDKDYITAWSYGVDETLTVLIPNFMGGSSHGSLDKDSETYKWLTGMTSPAQARQYIKALPLYYGDQPFTSGPVYFGAVVMLLFVFSLFVLRGPVKWWLIVATLLSLFLAWGRNFMWFTDLFIEYFPGYNKFRTVSMTLVIAQVTVPLMGLLAIKKIMDEKISKEKIIEWLKYSLYIVGGIALIFSIFPGLLTDFSNPADQQSLQNQAFINAIEADRKNLLRGDAFRSLVFVILTAILLWAFVTEKLKRTFFFAALGLLFIVDMWPVNKRYINNDNFVKAREIKQPYKPNTADQQILQENSMHYRVFNTTARLDQDARTSYFHNSLGGYHGAKMQRYQEMIDRHIGQGNMDVINMLNAKYFITSQNNQKIAQRNPGALGNAWFVNKVKLVENADAEIAALNDFDPTKTAIVDQRFSNHVADSYAIDSAASIKLTSYSPKKLEYKTKSKTKQLAVFSEVYYPAGWEASIDGKPAKHIRVNYILRALEIPAGEHSVTFEFRPQSYYAGRNISLASSIILILFVIGVFGVEIRSYFRKEKE